MLDHSYTCDAVTEWITPSSTEDACKVLADPRPAFQPRTFLLDETNTRMPRPEGHITVTTDPGSDVLIVVSDGLTTLRIEGYSKVTVYAQSPVGHNIVIDGEAEVEIVAFPDTTATVFTGALTKVFLDVRPGGHVVSRDYTGQVHEVVGAETGSDQVRAA